jgi:hypothetical protein
MTRILAVAALAATLATATLVPSASASQSMTASGSFTVTAFNETFEKYAGAPPPSNGNLFFAAHDLAAYTGTFTGTHIFDGTVEIFKDGSAAFHGTITFTGAVAGCGTGTVLLEVSGTADASGVITRDQEQTLPGGTLPVHASLDFAGQLPNLTYTGTYAC